MMSEADVGEIGIRDQSLVHVQALGQNLSRVRGGHSRVD